MPSTAVEAPFRSISRACDGFFVGITCAKLMPRDMKIGSGLAQPNGSSAAIASTVCGVTSLKSTSKSISSDGTKSSSVSLSPA